MTISDKNKASMYMIEGSKISRDPYTEFQSAGLGGRHATGFKESLKGARGIAEQTKVMSADISKA